MTTTTLILLFVVFTACVKSEDLWRAENIREMRKLKECFSGEHAALISGFFPLLSFEREKREAIALDALGRLVKSGTPFCHAFRVTVLEKGKQKIENKLYHSTKLHEPRWRATLERFNEHVEENRNRCETLPVEDTGSMSTIRRCLTSVFHATEVAKIKAQFHLEEEGMKNL